MNLGFELLSTVSNPLVLRTLNSEQLKQLAAEMRRFLVQSLNKTGGHFAGNLAVIELTLALHNVFNPPIDTIIWDVGHQAYAHKILTGRFAQMAKLRQKGGLSGFPKRSESFYDAFGVGHSSTAISAALGMAVGAKLKRMANKTIAIVGDGALTGGMAYEALQHAGTIDPDLLVIVNDNSGSAMHPFPYAFDGIGCLAHPEAFFTALNLPYAGPIDGHDLNLLLSVLTEQRQLTGSRCLHIKTKKGKGYPLAEENPQAYHFVQPGYLSGTTAKPKQISYAQVFGHWLCDMAQQDPRLIAITPAMGEGSGLREFSQRFPERYIDVGIAEQHAVTLAAGLACAGLKPIVAIYSTFLQRAYDQVIHDVALQNLPVLFAIDRAGIVGADGATHMGNFDLSYLRCIPNLIIMAPADEAECRNMLYTAYLQNNPVAVRYPRGTGPGVLIQAEMQLILIGKAKLCRQGQEIAILAFGSMLTTSLQVGDHLNATVFNMRFVKPLDSELLQQVAKEYRLLVTVEENTLAGGAGSAVNENLLAQGIAIPVLNLGIPDHFIEQGTPGELLTECGLDAAGITQAIRNYLTLK